MAVPRRKTSPSRRGMRRSADALKKPTYVEDKDSGELRKTLDAAVECMKLDNTIAKMHEKWFGVAPAAGSAAVTVFPGYGVPDMPGYDPTAHTPSCS